MQNEVKRVRKLKGGNKYLWIVRIDGVVNKTLFAKSQTKALAQALRLEGVVR